MNENKQVKDESANAYEFEMLKQRYETLEKTLTNAEKEKDYFQVKKIDFFRIDLSKYFFGYFCRKCTNKPNKNLNISKKNI